MRILRRKYPDIIPARLLVFIDLGQHLANTDMKASACLVGFGLSFQALGLSRRMK
jgi:hypothetical protein